MGWQSQFCQVQLSGDMYGLSIAEPRNNYGAHLSQHASDVEPRSLLLRTPAIGLDSGYKMLCRSVDDVELDALEVLRKNPAPSSCSAETLPPSSRVIPSQAPLIQLPRPLTLALPP